MPDNNKKPFKEKRKERQDKRVEKLTQERKAEAQKAGVDTIDIGPLGAERKARIDESIQKGVGEDFLGGLKRIQEVRQAPDVEVPVKPTTDLTIKDVRKQRRAKTADILSALGQGLKGKEVDPTKYRDLLKGERDVQYQQYRDTSQAAKKRLEEWQTGYIDEQLEYLDDKLVDPRTSELEKIQIKKAKAELDDKLAKLGISREKLRQLKESKEKPKEEEVPTAKYVRKIGEDETVTRQIPIAEAQEKEKQAQISEAVKQIDFELEQAKRDLIDMGKEGTRKREFIDRPKRETLESKIQTLEEQRQQIIDEIEGSTPTQPTTTTPKQAVTETTEEDDLWNL